MAERIQIRPLRTPRIALQIPSIVHVDGIHSSFGSDPEVTRFLAWQPARSRDDSAAAMSNRLRRLADGDEFSWILVLRMTDQVFGSLSLWPRPDGAEIGFALARSYWGQGLAAEAGHAAIQWARQALRPRRIWATCDPENERSARALSKLGFVEVGLQARSRVRPNLSSLPRDSRVFELPSDGGKMFETEVLSGPSLGPWIGPILTLDRANMAPILRASNLEFPETRRLALLSDPGTQVVIARVGCALAGYVELAPDKHDPRAVYVSSLQIAAPYRRGPALAHLLGRMGAALGERPPSFIRIQVQRANVPALALFTKLGFLFRDAAPDAVTLEAVAGPEILRSPRLLRLARRFSRATGWRQD